MRIVRKLYTSLAVAVACAVTLSACASGDPGKSADAKGCDDSSLPTVRVSEVIHSVFYAPQYVAQSQKFFCEAGIKIDTTTSEGSDKGTAALLSGAADVALVGPETAIFVNNNPESTQKVKVFAQVTATDGSFLVGHSADSSFDWSHLKGKTVIGWRPGSQPEMVLEYILKQHGLTPGKDVTVITNLAAPAMAGAFLAKQADYVTLYQPTVAAVTAQGASMLRPLGADIGELPQTVYTATEEYIKTHGDIIQKFTNAIAAAETWLQDATPEEIAKAEQPYFESAELSDLVASATSYREIKGWPKSPLMTQQGFDTLQKIMISAGVLKQEDAAQYSDIVDPTFAEKAPKGNA